ncbi:MAG: hypothetical protein RL441_1184 [Actinomycetota bacterium]
MIQLNKITFNYSHTEVVHDFSLSIQEGELLLIAGPTGSGKSTILNVINGLVPEFTGGSLSGSVRIDGVDRATVSASEWSRLVATVTQSPIDGFVADVVEDEIAFGMETHGFSPDAMRQRVEEVLDLLGLSDLRNRHIATLSGGQQQRVAIAAALTLQPRVLLMDEPTSALDPTAADEVFSTVHRLVHDLGLTVIVAEHRIERIIHYADSVLLLDTEKAPIVLAPEVAVEHLPTAPALTQLARLAGAEKSPLTVRDARKVVEPLRQLLQGQTPPLRLISTETPVVVEVSNASVMRDRNEILKSVSAQFKRGSITALMGRNGAGKSTLLHTLIGDFETVRGSAVIKGKVASTLQPAELVNLVGIVPQQPSDLFLCDRISDECRTSDKLRNVAAGTTRALLALLSPAIDDAQHPRDLSEGQRLGLALAIALAGNPPVLLLDEPTRGLDSAGKLKLIEILTAAAADGRTVILATHDVELAAEIADEVVVLSEGEVVAAGPAADVLTASTMFAPITTKVLAPLRWLSVNDVRASLN